MTEAGWRVDRMIALDEVMVPLCFPGSLVITYEISSMHLVRLAISKLPPTERAICFLCIVAHAAHVRMYLLMPPLILRVACRKWLIALTCDLVNDLLGKSIILLCFKNEGVQVI